MQASQFVEYKGHKFWPSKTNPKYYYADFREAGKRKKKALHRYIWEEYNSRPVPAGYDVHHIDKNTFNNNPENLILAERSSHRSTHQVQRWSNPKYQPAYSRGLEKARDKAREWHKSEEAKPFHIALGKLSWKNRRQLERVCLYCGEKFQSFIKAKYCQNKCYQNHRYALGKDFETRLCRYCSKEFKVRKNESTRCCSKSCAGKLRKSTNLTIKSSSPLSPTPRG